SKSAINTRPYWNSGIGANKSMPSFSLLAAFAMAGFAQAAEQTPELRPTIGEPPPEGAVVLFHGEDLSRWVKLDGKTPADWPVEDGAMTVGQGNIRTKDTFGDFQLHIEFQCPYLPDEHGQARGNSGVYLQ